MEICPLLSKDVTTKYEKLDPMLFKRERDNEWKTASTALQDCSDNSYKNSYIGYKICSDNIWKTTFIAF